MKCPCPTERQPSSGLPQFSWHGQRISLRIHHHDWVLFVQLSSGPKRPPHPAVPMRDGPEVSTLVPAWVIAAVYPSSVSPAFRLRFGSVRAHWLMVPVALPGHRATEAAIITASVPPCDTARGLELRQAFAFTITSAGRTASPGLALRSCPTIACPVFTGRAATPICPPESNRCISPVLRVLVALRTSAFHAAADVMIPAAFPGWSAASAH